MTTRFLASAVSLLAITVASSAIAQTVPATEPASQDNAIDAAGSGEEVVVTGIRRSLADATALKRNNVSIVDAISSEDIGRFPDQNLAESLQRVTGVQITRNKGEGSRVALRGLGPNFTQTQYNGRQIATPGGGRSFSFTSLSSDFVSAVEVFKSPSAE